MTPPGIVARLMAAVAPAPAPYLALEQNPGRCLFSVPIPVIEAEEKMMQLLSQHTARLTEMLKDGDGVTSTQGKKTSGIPLSLSQFRTAGHTRKAKLLSCVAAALAFLAAPVCAQTYEVVDYPGSIYTSVSGGPTQNGDVVGTYAASDNTLHGFLRNKKGGFTLINYPGAVQTQINGIVNSTGEIVGQWSGPGLTRWHGFVLDKKGNYTAVDFPDSSGAAIGGMNTRGDMIGSYFDSFIGYGAFVQDKNGAITVLTHPDATILAGATINSSGDTVSKCALPGYTKFVACLIRNGKLTIIDYPGSASTLPGGGDSVNDVTGVFLDQQGYAHGFLYIDGNYTSFDMPGALHTYGMSIGSQKEVVGQFTDASFRTYGFIRRP
jgi:hypothetical protein